MTFGELVDGRGAKIGVGIENAGGAAALEIDGRTVVLQMADDDLLLVRADLGEIPPDRRDARNQPGGYAPAPAEIQLAGPA